MTAAPKLSAWAEDPLTARSRAVWTSGDFHPIAESFARGASQFIAHMGIRPGEQLLDVACGTGNLAIPAARAGARVTGVDIAPNLIAVARVLGRDIANLEFEVGDAEALPYMNDRFDTTVTMFGSMFAYRPAKATAELFRVTRPGGRIAMANWTREGFIGSLLKAHVAIVPPPAGPPSPLMWGQEEVVTERFGTRVSGLSLTRRLMELRFPFPPEAVTELFATHYGPTIMTLRAADPFGRSKLRAELTRLFTEFNEATDGGTAVRGEYLDVQGRVE